MGFDFGVINSSIDAQKLILGDQIDPESGYYPGLASTDVPENGYSLTKFDASVGLLYKEAVGKLMTEESFVDAVGFSNFLPGSEALKLAMFVGYAAGGVRGVFTALLGAVLPPTVMMFVVALRLQQLQQEDWLGGFVKGMSPAVAALIGVGAWELFRGGKTKRIGKRAMIIAALSVIA